MAAFEEQRAVSALEVERKQTPAMDKALQECQTVDQVFHWCAYQSLKALDGEENNYPRGYVGAALEKVAEIARNLALEEAKRTTGDVWAASKTWYDQKAIDDALDALKDTPNQTAPTCPNTPGDKQDQPKVSSNV